MVQSAPQLVSDHVSFFSSDLLYAITYDAVNANIERLSDGQKWQIHNSANDIMTHSPKCTGEGCYQVVCLQWSLTMHSVTHIHRKWPV